MLIVFAILFVPLAIYDSFIIKHGIDRKFSRYCLEAFPIYVITSAVIFFFPLGWILYMFLPVFFVLYTLVVVVAIIRDKDARIRIALVANVLMCGWLSVYGNSFLLLPR